MAEKEISVALDGRNSQSRSTAVMLLLGLALVLAQPSAQAGRVFRYVAAAAALSAAHAYAKDHLPELGKRTRETRDTAPVTGGDACTAQLPMGRRPTLTNPKWQVGLTTLCYQEYTVAFSEKTRTPLWSAEYLTRQRIQAARKVKRENTFHEETLIPVSARSHLKDYLRSGYDRGHLSPSGDFTNPGAQHESFSLANIIPQNPDNNRKLWEGIESGTRNYAVTRGAVYVITGPLFVGQQIDFLKTRVAIPTHVWKLLYDPGRKAGGVYLVQNTSSRAITWKSIAEFEQSSGYHFNLGSPALLPMPTPEEHF